MKIAFLGTPDFVQVIKQELGKHFTLVDSLKEADLAVIAAYGKILTEEELNSPKFGCINVHPSLLPKYRGPSPIQSAILNEDKTSGISIIKIDAEVDHGPILYQDSLELSDKDTFDILSKKMFLKSSEVLPTIIKNFIDGKITPIEQDHSSATYCKHLTRESGYFDINNPPSADKLDKMIRAYYPWPGVWTRWRNSAGASKIVKFIPNSHPELDSGSIQIDSDFRQNDEGRFLIQMEGKKAITFKDFLNGYPDFPLNFVNQD